MIRLEKIRRLSFSFQKQLITRTSSNTDINLEKLEKDSISSDHREFLLYSFPPAISFYFSN